MRTHAFVIKKNPTKEFDQLVTCYTQEYGKLTAVAKGSLRNSSKQRMHLDGLNKISFEVIHGQQYPIIASAQLEEGYQPMKNSLIATAMGHFFLEVIDKVAFEEQKDLVLWNFLDHTLSVCAAEHGVDWFKERQQEFLRVLGHGPGSFSGTFDRRFLSLDLLNSVI